MSPATGLERLRCPPALIGTQFKAWRFALDLPQEELIGLASLLDDRERDRVVKFRHPLYRDRFIARRGRLRQLLASECGLAAAALQIEVGPYGKPVLLDVDLCFSASSSGGLGLCVVAKAVAIGCDVAEHDPAMCDMAVAERLFHPDEYQAIRRLPDHRRTAAFLTCWTRKEAYVKAVGIGLHRPLDSFAVSIGPEPCPELRYATPGYSLHNLNIGSGYHAAVCVGPNED